MRVAAGSTVRWTNAENVFHTVTSTASLTRRQPSGLFNRTLAARGQSFEFKFDQPGTYHFYCTPHSDFMAGSVVVT